ncbi:MAG TPA: glycosyltransferase family 2 protein [Planctomycetaceae bacterium]|nr:glycosyltransferase family 2 protein [Planctomycetaceae bacterium]
MIVCLALAVGGLCQSALMLVHAYEQRRHYARRLASAVNPDSDLPVTLIIPCKGIERDLRKNLGALFGQRYPKYTLCFVVESDGDPAVPIIGALMRENPQIPSRLVIAGHARDCGQKVHNLMFAAQSVLDTTDQVPDVLAFVDSDACPHSEWLARLISRLASGKNAVATGYRWYLPATRNWANRVLSAINNVVIGLTGPHGFNLVWGGAWAIRTENFRALGLPEVWRASLSDDLVVSRLVREAGMRVAYEPHCLVISAADFTPSTLFEFLRRQFLVVRIYAPLWWQFAFWTGLATNLCFWGTVGLAAFWGLTRGPWPLPLAAMAAYYLAGALRCHLAARAVRPFVAVLDADYDRVARLNIWGWPLVVWAAWLATASASFGRTIVWRGVRYRLDSSRHTTVFENSAELRQESDSHARTTTRAA